MNASVSNLNLVVYSEQECGKYYKGFQIQTRKSFDRLHA